MNGSGWLPILALAALLVLAGCGAARQMRQPAAADLHPLDPSGTLYSAGQPQAGDWDRFRERGVVTVVNLRTPVEMGGRDEAAEVAAAGMRYVSIPVDGASGITDDNARSLRAALDAANGPVLVHCATGNRAGGLIALMAARVDAMPAGEAIELGRRAGMSSTESRVRSLLDTSKR